ncbi:MAG: DUF1080 domain-containing protein [Thermoguttaceae bacterium]|nr:DUF1080 domain-containing protein [Thermoguttaceae bacterium]MDW8038221.1 DUF1080 domain-containing protein [Thermoguttaceae bacterium]
MAIFGFGVLVVPAEELIKPKVFTDPAQAGLDFADQGEYVGEIQTQSGPVKYGAQVIALGDGKFHAVGYPGGLPGEGWDGGEKVHADGHRQADRVVFALGEGRKAELAKGTIVVLEADGQQIGKLQKVERKSPTLGAKPPAGAVVLFDGTSADNFQGGRITPDGLLIEGATSKQKFDSCTIHLEFRTPFMPYARGQDRGNSGVYVQGRYEVQILDSFGLEGLDNECGAIYGVARPKVNMCFPPLSWQTYDIEFQAAKWHNGQMVQRPRMTVRHNGVVIHENVELPFATRAAPLPEGPEKGPLFLQDHGCPVRFRNIWVLPKPE